MQRLTCTGCLFLASLSACTGEPTRGTVPVAARAAALLEGDTPSRHRAFRSWLDQYLATSPEERFALDGEGEQLAAARRAGFAALLREDPRLALELAVSPVERALLPEEIAANLEHWRDGIGTLHVIGGLAEDGQPPPPLERFVTFRGDETPLRAGVFGAREEALSRVDVRLHGVSLDGNLALTERRLRRLWPGETRPELPVEWPRACPVSKKRVDAEEVYHGGDTLYGFCMPTHADAYDGTLALGEQTAAIEAGLPPASAWTEGAKTILYVRVDYPDLPGDPVAAGTAQAAIDTDCNQFYVNNSYGKTSMTTTVTPTLRLPKAKTYYQDAGAYLELRSDALAAARDAGFDPSAYSNDIVAFPQTFSGWTGRGYIGTRGTWLNGSFGLRTAAHELGHNYGAYHANAWSTATGLPIGPGTSIEYGNPFDIMGGGGGQPNHLNAWFKSRFGWFGGTTAPTVTASGTYRLQALEPTVTSGLQALRLPRDGQRDYWLEYRPALNTANTREGVSLNWGFPANTQSQLLDLTPGDNNRNNSTLIIGRTFSDAFADKHVTPIGRAGTTPEAVDVVINLGPFPGNRAPTLTLAASATTVATNQAVTFTATASDPDGDALAYAWSFDDGTWGPNTATVMKTFTAARAYAVRLTVSDMKGLTASATVLLTVGTPTTFVLSGTATAGGQGLADVRVSDGTRSTTTTTNGAWVLTNVPAGSATLTATKLDYTFSRSFAAPLTVAGSQSGLDFTGTLSAGYTLAGKVTSAGIGVAGVVVSDGSRTATTNATGDYTISGVPSGAYTLTATLPGYGYGPSGFTNPVEVFGANGSGLNFVAVGSAVSGSIPSGVTTAPVITDGIRSVTATRQRTTDPWGFVLSSVPSGTWNLVATSPGVTLTPGNFTNPITINNANRSGLTFQVATTASWLVQGAVRTGGTPLPGVVVSDGTRSATTDTLGRYTLVGVPAGTYTVTPTLAGYTFVPATMSVTVTSANVTGQDFNTTVVNLPPTVATAASATPTPVTTGTSTALAVLGADDQGEVALRYAWSASGPWPVNFSATGTNGAKSATATFTGAGTYTLECLITDAGGLSVRSVVQVSVQQALSGLDVTPATANVMTGATQQFQAAGRDQFGRAMVAGSSAWAVSGGGTIGSTGTTGTFVAGGSPGGPFTVTATAGGRSATATVTVTGTGAPSVTTAASATPNPVSGATTRLSVRATDDTGEPALTYRWSMTQGPAPVTYSANDTNLAKDADVTFTSAGDYDFLVSVIDGAGNVTTSAVSVVVQATPTRVDVQPSVVSLAPGQQQQFSASAFDQFDEPLLPSPAFTWSAPAGGTVDAMGLFTAGPAVGGPFTLTVSFGGQSDTAQVSVSLAPDTEPPTVAITSPAAGSRLAALTPVTAEATDNLGVTRVEFFVDGASVGAATAEPWQVGVDPATLTDGAHVLTARASDAAGNTTTSAPVTVTVGDQPVDVTPPTVRITAPAAGEETGLVVRVETDTMDDVGLASVALELDGAPMARLTAPPWRSDLEVAVGAHVVVAVATDTSGNAQRSDPVRFTAVDGLPPPVLLGEPERVVGSCGCASMDPAALFGLPLLLALRRRRGGLLRVSAGRRP